MNRKVLITLSAAVAILLAGGLHRLQEVEGPRPHLNKGVQAFKSAKYADAVEFFKQAIELDPHYPTARLYLATAYMSQYIPGAESPENTAFAEEAAKNFKVVLEKNPKDTTALKSLASLAYQSGARRADHRGEVVKRLDEAAEWYKKLAEVDPNEQGGLLHLWASSAWAKCYPALDGGPQQTGDEAGRPWSDQGQEGERRAPASSTAAVIAMRALQSLKQGAGNRQRVRRSHGLHEPAVSRTRRPGWTTMPSYKKDTETADSWHAEGSGNQAR